VNSILYQRGIYPPEDFEHKKQYGLPMFLAKDAGLKKYLNDVVNQLSIWLESGEVQKLVIVIASISNKEVLERWIFDIHTEKPKDGQVVEKSQKEITTEIQAIIRQITASVTFLPLLSEPCTFDLLVYTNADVEVPKTWEESDPRYITNSSEVRLRSFTTKIHRVEPMVSFKDEN